MVDVWNDFNETLNFTEISSDVVDYIFEKDPFGPFFQPRRVTITQGNKIELPILRDPGVPSYQPVARRGELADVGFSAAKADIYLYQYGNKVLLDEWEQHQFNVPNYLQRRLNDLKGVMERVLTVAKGRAFRKPMLIYVPTGTVAAPTYTLITDGVRDVTAARVWTEYDLQELRVIADHYGMFENQEEGTLNGVTNGTGRVSFQRNSSQYKDIQIHGGEKESYKHRRFFEVEDISIKIRTHSKLIRSEADAINGGTFAELFLFTDEPIIAATPVPPHVSPLRPESSRFVGWEWWAIVGFTNSDQIVDPLLGEARSILVSGDNDDLVDASIDDIIVGGD